MAQIVIRGLDDAAVARLKVRAVAHGRSLESEARTILESASGFSVAEARRVVRNWQQQLAGRKFSDSSDRLHEDRRR